MVVFPNAKINIGLNIISKRQDGFHNLETIFYPVPWRDVLEILPSEETEITITGIEVAGKKEDNLCLKVYHHLKNSFKLPPVKIHLHKNIPVGAGLGGGSSDAAFTLKALNELFHLGISEADMISMIRPFGSDCAFFIKNVPVFAQEKGDIFSPADIDLTGKYIILIYPDLSISTKEAYQGIHPDISRELHKNIHLPLHRWKEEVFNDFETSLFRSYPVLESIKVSLYDQGALYASMSGSGSTIYGIFEDQVETLAPIPSIYQVFKGRL